MISRTLPFGQKDVKAAGEPVQLLQAVFPATPRSGELVVPSVYGAEVDQAEVLPDSKPSEKIAAASSVMIR